jgi:very-short-patch-repair endonuclease
VERVSAGAGDREVARIAAGQRGLVTYAELRGAGLGRGAIEHRIRHGRLHRMYRGVYLVGHSVAPPLARELGAVLACGDGAVVSHRCAAQVWGLLPEAEGDVDVTVPGSDREDRDGIHVHGGRLDPRDVTRHQGLPLSAPARTLIDVAGTSAEREVERAYAEALARRLVTRVALQAAVKRAGRRAGVAVVRRLLEAEHGPALTRSEAEERLLALLRAGGLPEPDTNARVGPYEVDFLWRTERLAVEVDGYAFHSSRAAFERDRRRDAELQDAGLRVRRVTWAQIVHEPEALLVRLARALQA